MNDVRNIFAAISHVCARNASYANLANANLHDAYLTDANLTGAYLSGANLYAANLRDANLSSANMRDASLREADLSGANLRNTILCDADLLEANLSGANITNTRGLVSVSGIGRSNRYACAYWTGSAVAYQVGCREEDEEKIRAAIDRDYANDDLERAAYHAAIDYLKIAFEAFMKRWRVGRYYQQDDEVTDAT